MADMTARDSEFSNLPKPKNLRLIVATGETHFEGEICEVLTASPTIARKGGDDAGVAFLCICRQTTEEGDGTLVGDYAHPQCGEEFGPYTYVPGSVTNALIGTQVCVKESGSCDLAGALTNDVVLGRISRPHPTDNTKVFIRFGLH
jgi:hypothetical protein